MKKLLPLLLCLMLALASVPALAMETGIPSGASSTAWLLYYAAPGWWPQHKTMDQPSSETGVEATNAIVTGPGEYTVGLKFNWQTAESALQFDLVLDGAEETFPGCRVDITDIRVNGISIPMTANNMYGVYHDDPASGFAPIYNNYWNAVETPGSTGPDLSTMRAFDGTLDTEHWEIIDPNQIVAGSTIEVDFTVALEADAAESSVETAPVGEMPWITPAKEAPQAPSEPEASTTAWLYYMPDSMQFGNETPEGSFAVISGNASVTGDGYYTVSVEYPRPFTWAGLGGAQKLQIVLENGSSLFPNRFLGVTDVRADGVSIDCGSVGYGAMSGDAVGFNGSVYATADDTYALLYDYQLVDGNTVPDGLVTWDNSALKPSAMDGSDIPQGTKTLEVDFFLSSVQNEKPTKPGVIQFTWYSRNTVGLAGLSLRELGVADDWHNVIPVDLTVNGWQRYTLVAADAHEIGHAYVLVDGDTVTVDVSYARGNVEEHSQCIRWYTSLDAITVEEIASGRGGVNTGDEVSIAEDLGGAQIAYLSINNKVTFSSPIDDYGSVLPRYWRNAPAWTAWREQLMTLIPVE